MNDSTSEPKFTGEFRGKIESKYNISVSNIFGWFGTPFSRLETGSGTSGKNFSLCCNRISLKYFPKMWNEYLSTGKLLQTYKNEYMVQLVETQNLYKKECSSFINSCKDMEDIKIMEQKLETAKNNLLKIKNNVAINKEKNFKEITLLNYLTLKM